jgi:hypothetical protein
MTEPIELASPAPPSYREPVPSPAAAPRRPTISVIVAEPPLSELAIGCLGKVDGVLIPFLSLAPNPLVAALVGVKAGSELRECVEERIAEASFRAGIQECLDNGGTPMGVLENVITCQVQAP